MGWFNIGMVRHGLNLPLINRVFLKRTLRVCDVMPLQLPDAANEATTLHERIRR